MEARETRVFTKTRRGIKERNKKLKSYCADVGDVEVCGVYSSSFGENKRDPKVGSSYMWEPLTASVVNMFT